MNSRILTIGFLLTLLTTIITSASTIYFYQETQSVDQQLQSTLQTLQSIRQSVMYINMTLDYGNGTLELHDALYLAPGQSVLDALRAVADINATYYEGFSAWLVDAINDVPNNENGNNRWWVFEVNGVHAEKSADAYVLQDGDQVTWIYYQY